MSEDPAGAGPPEEEDEPDVVTVDYQVGPGDELRPYLWLELTGPNGRSGDVRGLIDTGADTCVLPLGFARLMGYTAADLQVEQCGQVSGSTTAYEALRPCTAIVLGLAEIEFEMYPLFIEGTSVLWGRRDFLDLFDFMLHESDKQFSLVIPEFEDSDDD